MAKVKVSEWSATPGNNTDIDGINLSEGCAPSGINDAIRELMSQLKDFQTGAAGDSFNGPVGSTTPAAGAFTTLLASGAVTLSGGTANGVPYLNGSKVLTTGTALTFDGTILGITGGTGIQAKIYNSGLTGTQASSIGVGKSETSGNTVFFGWANNNGSPFGYVGTYGGGAPLVLQPDGGNLGLGVTPSAWAAPAGIDIGAFAGFGQRNDNGWAVSAHNAYFATGATWRYKVTGLAAAYYGVGSGTHQWYTAPSGTAGNAISFTQAMTLDSSGNLLVGKTTSGANTDGSQIYPSGVVSLGHASGTVTGTAYAAFGYANGNIGSITQNGTTAVAYNTTSDHRLKNNVRTADALRFKDIRFVDFEWVDGRHDCGVIAHELQAIYPDLVVGTKDETEVRTVELTPAVPAVLDEEGNVVTPEVPAVTEEQTFDKHQQVNYIGLIPRMGTIVQQLMAKVEAMEAEIAALKAAP